MKINTKEIKHVITHLKAKDMHRIEVSNRHLRHLRANPDSIYQCKLSTIMKIQNYANQEKNRQNQNIVTQTYQTSEKTYVGVDIGVSNLITISNGDMTQTVKLKTKNYPQIKKAIKQYNDAIKHIQKHVSKRKFNTYHQDFKHTSKKLIRTIEPTLNKILRENVITQFPKNTVYIVGINHLQINKYDTHALLVDCIINILRRIFDESPKLNGSVLTVNERKTSITCPKCHKANHQSRTSNNQFDCKYCDFKHEDDDVVASFNILNNYLKIKKAGVKHG